MQNVPFSCELLHNRLVSCERFHTNNLQSENLTEVCYYVACEFFDLFLGMSAAAQKNLLLKIAHSVRIHCFGLDSASAISSNSSL